MQSSRFSRSSSFRLPAFWNRYRYNGKEEQSSLYPASYGDQVSYIDYGARHYDPAIGRWLSVDPLAEKYYSISPYAFCNNNPVNFVDPDCFHRIGVSFSTENRRIEDWKVIE
jgi:RHS repeat-associated protein